jgi:hypothetical protein
MSYSNDDVRKLYLDIDRITKFDNTITSLEELEKRLRKEVNFQDGCKRGATLGNALLECAIENNNQVLRVFSLKMGVNPFNKSK